MKLKVLRENAALVDGSIDTALRVQVIEKVVKLINRNILTMNANISAEQKQVKQTFSKPDS